MEASVVFQGHGLEVKVVRGMKKMYLRKNLMKICLLDDKKNYFGAVSLSPFTLSSLNKFTYNVSSGGIIYIAF